MKNKGSVAASAIVAGIFLLGNVTCFSLLPPKKAALKTIARAEVAADDQPVTDDVIGRIIDAARYSYDDFGRNEIFTQQFLDNIVLEKTINTSSRYLMTSHTSYSDLIRSEEIEHKSDRFVSTRTPMFYSRCNETFSYTFMLAELSKPYISQMYYHVYSTVIDYKKSMKNMYAEYTLDDYDEGYIEALKELKAGTQTYEDFFNRFGTHVVAGYNYGTSVDVYYGVLSKTVKFDGECRSIIDQAVHDSIEQMQTAKTCALTLPSEGKLNSGNATVISKFFCNGAYSVVTDGRYSPPNVSDWIKNQDSNIGRVGYSDLLPLYWILPKEYSDLLMPMKNAFEEYAASKVNLYENAVKEEPADLPIDSGYSHSGKDDSHSGCGSAFGAPIAAILSLISAVGAVAFLRSKQKKS